MQVTYREMYGFVFTEIYHVGISVGLNSSLKIFHASQDKYAKFNIVHELGLIN